VFRLLPTDWLTCRSLSLRSTRSFFVPINEKLEIIYWKLVGHAINVRNSQSATLAILQLACVRVQDYITLAHLASQTGFNYMNAFLYIHGQMLELRRRRELQDNIMSIAVFLLCQAGGPMVEKIVESATFISERLNSPDTSQYTDMINRMDLYVAQCNYVLAFLGRSANVPYALRPISNNVPYNVYEVMERTVRKLPLRYDGNSVKTILKDGVGGGVYDMTCDFAYRPSCLVLTCTNGDPQTKLTLNVDYRGLLAARCIYGSCTRYNSFYCCQANTMCANTG